MEIGDGEECLLFSGRGEVRLNNNGTTGVGDVVDLNKDCCCVDGDDDDEEIEGGELALNKEDRGIIEFVEDLVVVVVDLNNTPSALLSTVVRLFSGNIGDVVLLGDFRLAVVLDAAAAAEEMEAMLRLSSVANK